MNYQDTDLVRLLAKFYEDYLSHSICEHHTDQQNDFECIFSHLYSVVNGEPIKEKDERELDRLRLRMDTNYERGIGDEEKVAQILSNQFESEDDYKEAVRIDKMIGERIEDDVLDGDCLIGIGQEINKLADILMDEESTERVGDSYKHDLGENIVNLQDSLSRFYDDTFFSSLQDKFDTGMHDIYEAISIFREVVAYRNLLNEIKQGSEENNE